MPQQHACGYTASPLCEWGEHQRMRHIVNECPLTCFDGGISELHQAQHAAFKWLPRRNLKSLKQTTTTTTLTKRLKRRHEDFPTKRLKYPGTLKLMLTFVKSADVAFISFHVLFNSWIQMQKNSSNGLSWVKNIGWYTWPSSAAKPKRLKVWSYIAQYPLARSKLFTLDTPWQIWSFRHQLDCSGKHSDVLQLLCDDYSLTYFYLWPTTLPKRRMATTDMRMIRGYGCKSTGERKTSWKKPWGKVLLLSSWEGEGWSGLAMWRELKKETILERSHSEKHCSRCEEKTDGGRVRSKEHDDTGATMEMKTHGREEVQAEMEGHSEERFKGR